MKRTLLVVAILLLLSPRAAAAGGGINLAWDECVGAGGAMNRVFACNTNVGQNVLVASFTLDQPMPDFAGVQVKVNLAFDTPTIPSWWDFPSRNMPSYCRDALFVTFDFGVLPGGCADPFGEPGQGGLAYYDEGHSASGYTAPNRAFFTAAGAIPGSTALVAGTEYYAARIVVTNVQTVGTGACSGCSTPACLELHEVDVVTSSSLTDHLFTPLVQNIVSWQNGSMTLCPVATRNTTWGQVKSLYR